jgi:peptidoglycan/LPS O-acetylase OafA/YrhL/lysophospholipase L1-like esterase
VKEMKLNSVMQLQDISTYRSELMGWAILWIMMLHFGFSAIMPLGFIAQYGYAGVDIFMFVSGFGLFFSLDKKPSLWDFYRRRIVRIFPAYYLVGIIASLFIFHDSLFQYLYRYSTVGFWIGGIFNDWYVPSIMLLYLLSPVFKRIGIIGQAILAFLLLIVSYLLVELNEVIDSDHYFLLYRIPAFLYGMICARWFQQGKDMRWFFLILVLCVPVFVWLYPQFHQVYRYKYLSVLFMMPVFLCFFVLISKYIKVLNPVMRRIGQASLETYLTQILFFCLIVKYMLIRSDILTITLIILCSVSSYWLHEALQRKRSFYIPSIAAYLFIATCIWYIVKWQPLVAPAQPRPVYETMKQHDDTLRIAMYGDSWVGMHPKALPDSAINGRPLSFHTCGIGGIKSGEIYELMFTNRQYLQSGPQYCVVIAGINDAAANVGSLYYCRNYELIIRHLLACHIRPVVIEIPDVDLKNAYLKKPFKDCVCDACRALITASGMYDVSGYRKDLYNYLNEQNLLDSILYVSKDLWNPKGYRDETLYLKDKIHLNQKGYQKLDSCIIRVITSNEL